MFAWFSSLPGVVRGPITFGGALVSAFSSAMPSWLAPYGFYTGIALVCFGVAASVWVWIKKPGFKLEPSHLIIVGSIGLIICVGLILWGVVWQSRVAASETRPLIVVSSPAQPAASPFGGPAQLVANLSPAPPADNAEKIYRFLQLKRALEDLGQSREVVASTSEVLKSRMRPDYQGARMLTGNLQQRWQSSQATVKKINDGLYQNRQLDLTRVPELSNPLNKAPDEDVYGDDGEGKYRFRTFHFLNVNILKQIDALSLDIKNELASVTREIEKMPDAKIINPN
jgi:hypothetical protein